MARVAVLAMWTRLPRGVIRPNICWLHASITVLAVRDRVTGIPLQNIHLAHYSARVLDIPYGWLEVLNEQNRFL